MELLKKITIKDVGTAEQIKDCVTNNQSVDLANVAGIAREVKSGVSNYGEWQALLGDFLAVNCSTGHEFRSSTAILPAIAQDLVVSALRGGVEGVDLAFTIYVNPDYRDGKPYGKGYKFGARPLINPKESDDVARLKALFPAHVPQAPTTSQVEAPKVEAPKTEAKTETEVKPAEAPKATEEKKHKK